MCASYRQSPDVSKRGIITLVGRAKEVAESEEDQKKPWYGWKASLACTDE
jgi:hypothetical protein